MIRSMTGFGRGEYTQDNITFSVEIKSVNHRYSDLSVKIPRLFSSLEEKVREYAGERINRGKVDIYINYDLFEQDVEISIDNNLASAYIDSLNKLKEQFDIKDEISLSLVTRFPEILKPQKVEYDDDKVWIILKKPLSDAIDKLLDMRQCEGQRLYNNIIEKVDYIIVLVDKIHSIGYSFVDQYRERLIERLKGLTENINLDESRLLTEIAIYADKCCIDEELVRLDSHIKEFKKTIGQKNSIGKKLDFIVQEMNREANTIASKVTDINIINYVIEIKSEIEKIREQIQNIE